MTWTIKEDCLTDAMALLEPLGEMTSRHMFGGYGIFESGDMFALVSSQAKLYFKVDDSNRERYVSAASDPYHTMPYYEVPANVLEDEVTLQKWARDSITIGHTEAPPKRPRKRR